MMKKIAKYVLGITLLTIIGIIIILSSQNVGQLETTVEAVENPIASEDQWVKAELLSHLIKLTSEEMGGRLIGTMGNQLATDYIAEEMKLIGLEAPNFTNQYRMQISAKTPVTHTPSFLELTFDDQVFSFQFGTAFMPYIARNYIQSKCAFESKFKVIDDPEQLLSFNDEEVVLYTKSAIEGYRIDLLFNEVMSRGRHPRVLLIESDYQHDGYFVVSPYVKDVTADESQDGFAVIKLSESATQLLISHKEGVIKGEIDMSVETVEGESLIGFLDGPSDEGFVIVAHFDHAGTNQDGTYNPGALDNASGTSLLLALAKGLSSNNPEGLDFYFVAANGEEEGLVGSEKLAYSGLIDKTKFKVINLDMVGAPLDVPVLVTANTESSKAFADYCLPIIQAEALKAMPSELGSSDHVSFETAGFVTIALVQMDTRFYHTPSDTIENAVDLEVMQRIYRSVLRIVAR